MPLLVITDSNIVPNDQANLTVVCGLFLEEKISGRGKRGVRRTKGGSYLAILHIN